MGLRLPMECYEIFIEFLTIKLLGDRRQHEA